MDMVKHLLSLADVALNNAWLTIGAFDGVHLGHQEIIRRLVAGAHAEGAPAVVLTFHPHPAVVVRGRQGALYLTLPDERAALLGALGVDIVITQTFDLQVAATTAADFIRLLKERLDLRQLWVGYDFALGHARSGNVDVLRQLGERFNYQLHVVPPVALGEEVISSSQIRALLQAGQVQQAGRLLGRPYRLAGQVIQGDGRGRTIGIPTANLETGSEKLVPGGGVYACLAEIDGRRWAAATNIGVRPTFDGKDTVAHVEAHLLDFSDDLYGRTVGLSFLERLRGEQRFANIQSLVAQIEQDIRQTRQVVAAHGEGLDAPVS